MADDAITQLGLAAGLDPSDLGALRSFVDSLRTPPSDTLATLALAEGAAVGRSSAAAEDCYEDLGLLGHGGMGEVRRVRDRHLQRVVARKSLHHPLVGTSAMARFLDEARANARLQHPNLVPVWPERDATLERALWLVVPRKLARVARVRAVMAWIEEVFRTVDTAVR